MNYEKIEMSKLEVNDIFAEEIKLKGRVAYRVKEIREKTMTVVNRTTGKDVNKSIKGDVYFLRSDK